MAEVVPFRGLRYAQHDLSALICPPYDVISPEEQRALYQRSPLNVVRLEYGESRPDDGPAENRYTRAAATLRKWLDEGVLARDEAESYYVHDQRFQHQGQRLTRRGLLARVRLRPWDEGAIRPHEHTLSKPKEDRLQLLRATRLNISPIMALYRDSDGRIREATAAACAEAGVSATARVDDEEQSIHRIDISMLGDLFQDKTLYVVDGHHRYETALAFLEERRSRAPAWKGDEPENFVLMSLVAREDAGLIVLPTHRLLKEVTLPDDFTSRLASKFRLEDVSKKAPTWTELRSLLNANSGKTATFALAMAGGKRLILQAQDEPSLAEVMPDDLPECWRTLGAAVVQEVVLRGILGIDQQVAAAEGSLAFTHDGDEALRLIESHACKCALLLRATPVDRILALADSGARMPQKSTYFYPKLPAGLVVNLLD